MLTKISEQEKPSSVKGYFAAVIMALQSLRKPGFTGLQVL